MWGTWVNSKTVITLLHESHIWSVTFYDRGSNSIAAEAHSTRQSEGKKPYVQKDLERQAHPPDRAPRTTQERR